ncbi:MAG: ABC transporter permease [Verrucomicrobiales bacterium]
MFRFTAIRFAQALLTIFAAMTITFFMVRLAPGDPLGSEREMPADAVERQKEYWGLDKPLPAQYALFLQRLVLEGDLGESYKYKRPIAAIIADGLPATFQLGALGFLVALAIGIPVGSLAAARKNSLWDYAPMALAMAGICLPTFVMGPLLQYAFAIKLNALPVAGWFGPSSMVLPVLTLGLFYSAYVARLTRGGMLEILTSDYIRTAKAKGVPPAQIILKHSLRGGLRPVVSFLGPALAGLLGGSIIVEKIFGIPGLGTQFITAATNRDYNLVVGATILAVSFVVFFNFLVDLLQGWLDPRIRLGERAR